MTTGWFARLSRSWRVGGGTYVAVVTTLTGIAMADPNHVAVWAWLAAIALTIPTLLVLIPAIYVVVPIVWHVSGIDTGGPTWPTTVAYVVCFAAGASVNVLVVHRLVGRLRARSTRRSVSASATSL